MTTQALIKTCHKINVERARRSGKKGLLAFAEQQRDAYMAEEARRNRPAFCNPMERFVERGEA